MFFRGFSLSTSGFLGDVPCPFVHERFIEHLVRGLIVGGEGTGSSLLKRARPPSVTRFDEFTVTNIRSIHLPVSSTCTNIVVV